MISFTGLIKALQFLLLPIRDWNECLEAVQGESLNCNFYYSLLGIETQKTRTTPQPMWELQFLLLPIRDWNNNAISDGIKFLMIAISITPY